MDRIRGRATLASLAPFLPAAFLLVFWIAWIPLDGGYFPDVWYPSALFLVALLAAVALGGRRWWPEPGAGGLALGLIVALAAWSFASMLWAAAGGDAWAASDEWLLYLSIAWLVALVPWRSSSAAVFLGLWSAAVAVACCAELVSALGARDLSHFFLESRWQQPTGYANTAAATGAIACWPALMLACRREVPAALRVLFLGVAVFLVEFGLLPQSRAALIALVPALVVVLALSPDRGRTLIRLAIVALAIAIAGPAIWDVFGTGDAGRPIGPALDDAARSMLLSIGVALVAGVLLGLLEGRVRIGPSAIAVGRRGALVAASVAIIAAAGFAVARGGEVTGYIGDRWAEFKSNDETPDKNPTRIFQHTSDKRYDYWRVSVAMFRDAPVGGAGAGAFERVYTQERRHSKPSRSPHSVWMRSLGETGAVGTLLLLASVLVLAVGLVRSRRRMDDRGRAIVAACAALCAYFLVHASFDWLELMPALVAPAVGLPFLALRLAAPPEPSGAFFWSRWRPPRWAGVAVGAVLALAAAGALALPYASDRYVDSAVHAWRSDPAGADRDLRRAASLNPLSPAPRLAAGEIALDRGRYGAARLEFSKALEVEDGWYPHFQLALLASREGDFTEARRQIALARSLNPPDLLLEKAAGLISRHRRIDPRTVDRKSLDLPLYKDPRHR